MNRGTGTAAVVGSVAVALCAQLSCGARTTLGEPIEEGDGGAEAGGPADARSDRPVVDSGFDSPPTACNGLALLDGPVRLLGDDGLNYVVPHVVAREDGFDIVGFQNNGPSAPSHATIARWAKVQLPARVLEIEWPVALDTETTTSGFAAANGNLLGTCHGANRLFTFQTHRRAYELNALVRRDQPGYQCFGLAARRGRWLTFWLENGNSAPLNLLAAEFSSDGELLAPPRPAAGWSSDVTARAYGNGLVWSHQNTHEINLTFLRDQGDETTATVSSVGVLGSKARLSRWPWRSDAVAVLHEEAFSDVDHTTLRLHHVTDSGSVLRSWELPRAFPVGVIPSLAATDHGLAVAAAEYDDYGSDTGTIHVSLVGEQGSRIGSEVDLRFDRGHLNDEKDFSIAANGEYVVLVWAVRMELPHHGVWGVLLGCP